MKAVLGDHQPVRKIPAIAGACATSSDCYCRARYYHPSLQRFISEDPIGLLAGDPNFYVYVRNSPLNFRDPEGQFLLPGAGIGFGIGFVAGAIGAVAQGGTGGQILTSALLGGVSGAITGGLPGLGGPLAGAILGGTSNLAGQLIAGSGRKDHSLNYGAIIGSIVGGAVGSGLGQAGAAFASQAGFGAAAQVATGAWAGAVGSLPQGLVGAALGR